MNDPIRMYIHNIEMRLKTAIPIMCNGIISEMQTQYRDCVDKFYDDYPNPVKYIRDFNTYKGDGENGFYRYSVSTIGRYGKEYHITAGIDIESDFLGDPYDDPVDYVFERTWEQGIHGSLRVKKMKTAPNRIFLFWFRGFKKSTKLKKIVSDALSQVGLGGILLK